MKKNTFLISTLIAFLFISSSVAAEKRHKKPVTTGKTANSQVGVIELEDVGSRGVVGARGGGGKGKARAQGGAKGKAKASGGGSGKKSTPSQRGKKR